MIRQSIDVLQTVVSSLAQKGFTDFDMVIDMILMKDETHTEVVAVD